MTRAHPSVGWQLVERAGLLVGSMAVAAVYAAVTGGFGGWGAVAVGAALLFIGAMYDTWRLRRPTTRAQVCVLAVFCAVLAWCVIGVGRSVGERQADVEPAQPVVVVEERWRR